MKKCSVLPLSRPVKVLRNMLLAAVIAMPIWAQLGFPVPTMEMHSAIVARRMLLDPGEVVLAKRDMEKSGMIAGTADTGFIIRETGGYAVVCTRTPIRLEKTYYRDGWGKPVGDGYYEFKWTQRCEVYPVEDGPTAVPLGLTGKEKSAEFEHYETGCAIVMLHIPDWAVEAKLEVFGTTLKGVRVNDGTFLFWVQNLENWAAYDMSGWPYVLKLYRADGSLWERGGTIPSLEG